MNENILENIEAEIDYLDDMAKRYEIFAKLGDKKSKEILNQIINLMKSLSNYKKYVVYDNSFNSRLKQ